MGTESVSEASDAAINTTGYLIYSIPTPVITAAVKRFKLTHRETRMLNCIYNVMTNTEIATELFISEETAKAQVRNLLKKLHICTRKDVISWEESLLNIED